MYAWSPLIIIEFAASGHSDALAVAFFVAALMIIRRRPGVSSTVAMTAGALVKLFPITLLPLAVRLVGWPRRLRGWVAAGAAVALGCGLRVALSLGCRAIAADLRLLSEDLAELQPEPLMACCYG